MIKDYRIIVGRLELATVRAIVKNDGTAIAHTSVDPYDTTCEQYGRRFKDYTDDLLIEWLREVWEVPDIKLEPYDPWA